MMTKMIVQGVCAILYAMEVALVLFVNQKKYKQKYYLKAKMTCSISFIAIATIFAAVSGHWKYYMLMLPALVFCTLGDLFLGIYQTTKKSRQVFLGIVAFLLAHLEFLVAWFFLDMTFDVWNIAIPVVGIGILLCLRKFVSLNYGKLWALVCIYSVCLTSMFTKGTQYMIHQPSISSVWIGVGALLFFISDFLINFIYFSEDKEKRNMQIVERINLSTYFFALLAFDMSILYY